jgi:hypothetical protein
MINYLKSQYPTYKKLKSRLIFKFSVKSYDLKEEEYFNREDQDEKSDKPLEFVKGAPLVPYGFDEDEEEDELVSKRVMRKKPLVSFALGSKKQKIE